MKQYFDEKYWNLLHPSTSIVYIITSLLLAWTNHDKSLSSYMRFCVSVIVVFLETIFIYHYFLLKDKEKSVKFACFLSVSLSTLYLMVGTARDLHFLFIGSLLVQVIAQWANTSILRIEKHLRIFLIFICPFTVIIYILKLFTLHVFEVVPLITCFGTIPTILSFHLITSNHIEQNKIIFYKNLKTIEDNNDRIIKLSNSLIYHDLSNFQMKLQAYTRRKKWTDGSWEDNLLFLKELVSGDLTRIRNMLFSNKPTQFEVRSLVSQLIFEKKYEDICTIPVGSILVHTILPSLIYCLQVFLDNAVEAGSSNIELLISDNQLIIEDNGCGFDTSKIKTGYSTKNKIIQGTGGYGLAASMELMDKLNIPMEIVSSIGVGTKICLDFKEVLWKNKIEDKSCMKELSHIA